MRFQFSVERQKCRRRDSANGRHARNRHCHKAQRDVREGVNVTIWVPTGVTTHVLEHEEGHRQISEYYYQNAAKIMEQGIGPRHSWVNKLTSTGTDLNAESNKALQQMATYYQ